MMHCTLTLHIADEIIWKTYQQQPNPTSITFIYKHQELQNEQKELQSIGRLMLTDLSPPFNIVWKRVFKCSGSLFHSLAALKEKADLEKSLILCAV